jgi:hypothetical protein
MSSVNINVILVGSELFSTSDQTEVSDAIQRTRNIFATVGLGINEVKFFAIPLALARGRQFIDSDSEAEALTDEWTVDNHALDLFFVLTYAGTAVGLSRVDGPCDKNAKGMDGSVVAIEGSSGTTGLATAHELAHYLGLSHDSAPGNLMLPSPTGNLGMLRPDQGNNMRDHCFVF